MYVCICIRIHVHACHVYIVCPEYIYTRAYLFRVHLRVDIILHVVSDGDDSAKIGFFFSESRGSTRNPIPPLPNTGMFASNAFQVLPASSDIALTLGRKNKVCFFGGEKNRGFETKGV